MTPDRCHVCRKPILPGQDSRECIYCGRIGHEECGAYLPDGGPDDWSCDVCWDEMVREYGEAELHAL